MADSYEELQKRIKFEARLAGKKSDATLEPSDIDRAIARKLVEGLEFESLKLGQQVAKARTELLKQEAPALSFESSYAWSDRPKRLKKRVDDPNVVTKGAGL